MLFCAVANGVATIKPEARLPVLCLANLVNTKSSETMALLMRTELKPASGQSETGIPPLHYNIIQCKPAPFLPVLSTEALQPTSLMCMEDGDKGFQQVTPFHGRCRRQTI